MTSSNTQRFNGWRIAGWGALLALLALPAIAMQFTPDVDWTGSDFLFAAVLLGMLGAGMELAVRSARNTPQRLGIALAVLGGFLTLWSNAAVGIIGSESEPTNLLFVGMVVLALVASLALKLRPAGMRWLMAALSAGQFVVGIVAGLWTMPGHAVEWGVLAFFALIWGASAGAFHRARRLAGS